MAQRKKERAKKKSSACTSFRLSDYPRMVVYGDLMLRGHRIGVEVALPHDWRAGLFELTPLSPSFDVILRHGLSRYDLIALNIAGLTISARLAAKADNTGRIRIFGEAVLRGLARSASFKWPRLFGIHGKPEAERKAQKNGRQ
jgi:hypothetical protein